MVCGTIGRPCPKVLNEENRFTVVGPHQLPPPCIYLFPATIPSPRNNPHPAPQRIEEVEILKAFHDCFKGRDEELNKVNIEVSYKGADTMRTTRIERDGVFVRESEATAIRRS
jgi:hypothetical protein